MSKLDKLNSDSSYKKQIEKIKIFEIVNLHNEEFIE